VHVGGTDRRLDADFLRAPQYRPNPVLRGLVRLDVKA